MEAELYLQPYLRAARRYDNGFPALLWASPDTQAARFDALVGAVNFHGRSVLDVGCGHADLLDHLLSRKIVPEHYVGLEALPAFVKIARDKGHQNAQIIEADFVREPARMLVGADIVVLCGSLNTLEEGIFHSTLRHAFSAATESLVFNFLCSSRLASAKWLTWHRVERVRSFAESLTSDVTVIDDYMDGDCTMALHKPVGGKLS
jgi:SAM-dependent methyltransferase